MTTQPIKTLAGLAIFFFTFLGVEYAFDGMMAQFINPNGVVIAQSMILGSSVAGFLLFPCINRFLRNSLKPAFATLISLSAIVCIISMPFLSTGTHLQIIGCVSFATLGIMGSAIHWQASMALQSSSSLSKQVACSYAAGLLLQFILNNVGATYLWQCIILAMFVLVLAAIIGRSYHPARQIGNLSSSSDENAGGSHQINLILVCLIVAVVLMTGLFGMLDNVVTLAHSAGSVNVGQWPRLFLILSALAAGCLYDFRSRRFTPVIMLCMALLSVVALLLIEGGFSSIGGLIVFYCCSGFYVIFFTSSFFIVSTKTKIPELWAGMGRVANNLTAIIISIPSLALVQTGSEVVVVIIDIALLIGISVALFSLYFLGSKSNLTRPVSEVPLEERLNSFSATYGLTKREIDVLAKLVDNEDLMQQVADNLGISTRMLQKHASSIYKKTGTQTRAGLTKLFWN